MHPIKEDVLKEGGTDLSRILNLSDAVFAVAITLLVLNIGVPEINGLSGHLLDQELARQLYGLMGRIASYVLSFVVIGIYWHAHHRIFQYIRRYDTALVRLNLVFLLIITFLPVPTGVIGRYGGSSIAVVFYAASLAVPGLLMVALWAYATNNHRLVDDDLNRLVISYFRTRFLIAPLIFLLSIPLAFVTLFEPTLSGPELAEYSWLLAAIAFIIHRQLYHKQFHSAQKQVRRGSKEASNSPTIQQHMPYQHGVIE